MRFTRKEWENLIGRPLKGFNRIHIMTGNYNRAPDKLLNGNEAQIREALKGTIQAGSLDLKTTRRSVLGRMDARYGIDVLAVDWDDNVWTIQEKNSEESIKNFLVGEDRGLLRVHLTNYAKRWPDQFFTCEADLLYVGWGHREPVSKGREYPLFYGLWDWLGLRDHMITEYRPCWVAEPRFRDKEAAILYTVPQLMYDEAPRLLVSDPQRLPPLSNHHNLKEARYRLGPNELNPCIGYWPDYDVRYVSPDELKANLEWWQERVGPNRQGNDRASPPLVRRLVKTVMPESVQNMRGYETFWPEYYLAEWRPSAKVHTASQPKWSTAVDDPS